MSESDHKHISHSEFAALWADVQPKLTAYLVSVTRNYIIADDLLQEVATVAFTKFDQYDPSRPFYPWVIGIARVELLRWRRAVSKERHVFSNETIARLEMAQQEIEAEISPRREALHTCLSLLTGKTRKLVELRYTQDLKQSAIAERMGMKASTVRSILLRARRMIKECIELRLKASGEVHG